MDSNAVFAVLLLIVGLAILTAEVFIPSGGLLGVITFLSLVVSLIFAYRAWGTSHPNVFGAFCVMLLLLVPTAFGLGLYMLPRTAIGKKVLLEGPDAEDLTPYLEETRRLEKLVGQFGSAVTVLNPGGLVVVNGQRLHAFSDGLSIESGESIEVTGVRGSRVVVRAGDPPPKDPPLSEPSNDVPSSFDFDFPSTDNNA
jgi:membrane-bound ClpP family serine protease